MATCIYTNYTFEGLLGQQGTSTPLPAKTPTENETEIETLLPSPGHVNKVGKRREIMFLKVVIDSPVPRCLPCRARTNAFFAHFFIFLVFHSSLPPK